MENVAEQRMVVGFWKRLLSDILDAIFLGIFGACLAWPLKSYFYKLGENGVWIGIGVTFLYTGIFQSAIGQGQSLAKKLLKIQVLRMDGGYLSLPMSFVRYSVVAMIFYNEWVGLALTSAFPSLLMDPTFAAIYGTAILVLMVGALVLVPLHPLKRGLHDLIAGSIVVYKGAFDHQRLEGLNDRRKANRAFAISGAIAVAIIILMVFMNRRFADQKSNLNRLLQVREQIASSTELQNVSVQVFAMKSFEGDAKTKKTIRVNGFLIKEKYDNKDVQNQIAQNVAQIVGKSYPDVQSLDGITVTVRTGFNIGIANIAASENHTFSVDGRPVLRSSVSGT